MTNASGTPQSGLKWLPSLTDLAFLLPAAFLFGRMEGVKTLLGDCDTGWHIRTGEWIVSNHQVPARDFFSFTKAGEPWFAWEWLTDVLYAWLNSHGGLATVVLASILLLACTFAILFRLAWRKSNPIVAFLLTAIAAITSSIHWLARPHLFSLLFLVLFYAALERVREGRSHWRRIPILALLPVATILWTNLHGGFFVGIILTAIYGAGEALKVVLARDRGALERNRALARSYFLTAAACVAASLVNPYFYHLHQHMIDYLTDSYQSQHIVEFLSLNFHHPVAMFFEFLLVAGIGAAFWHVSRGRYTEAILVFVWAHGALLATRNLPLYALIATPIIAAALEHWLQRIPQLNLASWATGLVERFRNTARETGDMEAVPRWHAVSAVAILAIAAVLYAPAPPQRFRSEYDPSTYPARAIAALAPDTSARIFTNDEWGDYLIYKLYPRTKVFVDGRSDFYGKNFEQRYLDVMNVKYDWESTLREFAINTILLPPDAPLAGALKESRHWRVVYDDGTALVFRSLAESGGRPDSIAARGGGRDREITKTQTNGDREITEAHTKT